MELSRDEIDVATAAKQSRFPHRSRHCLRSHTPSFDSSRVYRHLRVPGRVPSQTQFSERRIKARVGAQRIPAWVDLQKQDSPRLEPDRLVELKKRVVKPAQPGIDEREQLWRNFLGPGSGDQTVENRLRFDGPSGGSMRARDLGVDICVSPMADSRSF